MLSLEEVRVDPFYANASMPYGIKITHIPTGIQVEGNCRMETSQDKLRNTLMDALGQFMANEMAKRPKGKSIAAAAVDDEEKVYMREQLRLMQAQIDRLSQPAGSKSVAKRVKVQRGKKASKMSAEQRAAVGQRLKAARAAKTAAAEPEPGPTEAELIAQQ